MTQKERRIYLLKNLINENPRFSHIDIPDDETEQRTLLRSLMNVRMPAAIGENFLKVQDEYLAQVNADKGIVTLDDLQEIRQGIYVWKGDITRLKAGAIVNAANSGMTGCYQPCHNCIDNCIHTYAGIQLRLRCEDIMEAQGYEEPTGEAKITPAYNLPCDYVIHTVGPIVQGRLNDSHKRLLASCYNSCLSVADEHDIDSIAFCCISTGVFNFPNKEAARIAVDTVDDYRQRTGSGIKVIFNVFKDEDEDIYLKILS